MYSYHSYTTLTSYLQDRMATSTRLHPEAGTAFDPTNIHGKMDTVIPMENLEGGIVTGDEQLLNTLDEPVLTTIKRDTQVSCCYMLSVF